MSPQYVHATDCNRELDSQGKHSGPCVPAPFTYVPIDSPPEQPEHDPVNHPTHYRSDARCSNCGHGIECIDVVRHLDFDTGNAIKYLWRAGKKDDLVQDLEKAVWYLQDRIAYLKGIKNPNVHSLTQNVQE